MILSISLFRINLKKDINFEILVSKENYEIIVLLLNILKKLQILWLMTIVLPTKYQINKQIIYIFIMNTQKDLMIYIIQIYIILCIYILFNQKMNDFLNFLFFHHFLDLRQFFQKKIVKTQPQSKTNQTFDKGFTKLQDSIQNQSQITSKHLFLIIYRCFQKELVIIFILSAIQSLLKLFSTLLILFLVKNIQDNNLNISYILSIILILTMIMGTVIQNNWCLKAKILFSYLQSYLTLIIYRKIMKLKQSTVNKHQIGKIINLISSDFNNVQGSFIFIFFMLNSPIVIFWCACILVYSLGWSGLISLIIPTISLFIQNRISKSSAQVLQNLNQFKDKRVEATKNFIESIRYTKLYHYQFQYGNKIKQSRKSQQQNYFRYYFYDAIQRAFVYSSSTYGLLLTYIVIWLSQSNELNLYNIFCSLYLITYFKTYIWTAQDGVKTFFQIQVIFKRFIQIYVLKDENNGFKNDNSFQNLLQDLTTPENLILHQSQQQLEVGHLQLDKFTGKWSEEGFQLKNITLKAYPGIIYGISGEVGSGKSTVLSAILNQMPIKNGKCKFNGKIAYVEQEPCLFNGTIRQNILFGREQNQKLYRSVIQWSCLINDLKSMTNGDNSMIGQNGMKLSGGQKTRIILARALYSQADIFLFDDPFSALDSKTSKYIFEKVFKQKLKHKTIILVTHKIQYLERCDYIMILKQGSIYSKNPLQFTSNINQIKQKMNQQEQENFRQFEQKNILDKQNKIKIQKSMEQQYILNKQFKKMIQPLEKIPSIPYQQEQYQKLNQNNFLFLPQNKQTFQIDFWTIIKYIQYSKKNCVLLIVLIIYIVSEGLSIITVRFYSKFNQIQSLGLSNYRDFWICLFAIAISYTCLLIIRTYTISKLFIHSTNQIHEDMLRSLQRSPLKYYDKMQNSILINKFSNDINVMDTSLIPCLINLIEGILITLLGLINVIEVSPYFLIPCIMNIIVTIFWFLYWKQVILYSYQSRLQLNTPIYQQMLFLIRNLTQIHIYQQHQNSKNKMDKLINNFIVQRNSCIQLMTLFRTYITYFSILSTSISIFLGLYFVNSAGSYAMCIVALIQIQQCVDYYSYLTISLQNTFLSSARCFSICQLQNEADLRTEYDKLIGFEYQIENQIGVGIKSDWPINPTIQYKNFSMKYHQNLEFALNNINLKIMAGQKVGIVGRTGGGKSSIIQSMFRTYESEQKSELLIGGFNAKKIGLKSLRSSLSIIPQTPFIFHGTIRENIDLFNQYTDDQIWAALQQCRLKQCISKLKQKLDTLIGNNLQTFSIGQKQLISLARVLISNKKIIVMDEATSNIDFQTQQLINKIIKNKFKGKTIVTIAHRLETIAQYDRIIVLDKGQITQQGKPYQLLVQNINDQSITSKGLFASMVKNSTQNGKHIFEMAKRQHFKQI